MNNILFFTLSSLTLKVVISSENKSTIPGGVKGGVGFSQDLEKITPQSCYNGMDYTDRSPQNKITSGGQKSSFELAKELGVDASVSDGVGMFEGAAQVDYSTSEDKKDISISYNYYEYAENDITVRINGFNEDALTKDGQIAYNHSQNPYFALLCGDSFVSSYKVGVLLTMTISIKFGDSEMKDSFSSKIGAAWGDLVHAEAGIKDLRKEKNITGTIEISAQQLGGEINKLSSIFNENSQNQANSVECSIDAMKACEDAATGLMNYAKSDLPKQFSFNPDKGLAVLGIKSITSMEYLGLTRPRSLLTREIRKFREELSCKMKKNEYYEKKLNPFVNGEYPVKLNHKFKKNVHSILKEIKLNLDTLRSPRIHDCFVTPLPCMEIKKDLNSSLFEIDDDFFNSLENMKYKFTLINDAVYSTGDIENSPWDIAFNASNDEKIEQIDHLMIKDGKYEVKFEYRSNDRMWSKFTYNGTSTDNSNEYWGPWCWESEIMIDEPPLCAASRQFRQESEFFFERFDSAVCN